MKTHKEIIAQHRAEIDHVDAELLRLLHHRARLASKLLALKRAAGLPICDPQRELEVLTRVCESSNGPLAKEAIIAIFQRIVEETRKAEEREAQAEMAAEGSSL